MSLITTCPACATTFRVTPEQLSAHRGDVRCGQCQHIFNALQQLEEIVAPVSPAEAQTEPVPNASKELEQTVIMPAADLAPPQPDQPETAAAETPAEELPVAGGEVDFVLEFATDEPVESVPEPEPVEVAAGMVSEIVAEPETGAADVPEQADALPEAEAATVVPEIAIAEPPPQPAAAVPSFLQPEPRRGIAFWLLVPLALLLLVGALGQSAYFLRTEIAAQYPPLRPWLERACRQLACVVELPRQADLLSIEDSDLQDDAEHAGVLVLVSALYNRASYPQAYPLLELTLTDTYDKPVLRRTFTPQEYLPAGTDIKAGIAAGGEIHSRLPLAVEGEKPAGYRLYVRY